MKPMIREIPIQTCGVRVWGAGEGEEGKLERACTSPGVVGVRGGEASESMSRVGRSPGRGTEGGRTGLGTSKGKESWAERVER